MVAWSRRGSRQIRHWVSSATLKQVSQNLTVSLTSLSVLARRSTSSASAARMWKASRCALFGPMPGSRPSSSMRSWTGPSYTPPLRLEGQARQAAAHPAGQRAELAGGQRLSLGVRVPYGGQDQVGQGLGVLGVDGLRLDGQPDQ